MTTGGWDTASGASESAHSARPGNGRGDERSARLASEIGKPIGVLFREVLDKTRALLREELRLAKAEVREQLELVGRNLVWIGVGSGLALAAILVLCLALDRGLTVLFAQFMDPEIAVWVVPLLLGLTLAAVGAALIVRGLHTLRQHLNLVPEKTKQTLKEDENGFDRKLRDR